MTHADAFLRDILAHPDDDAPRLIFADWLEEQGDAAGVARAEFIRVQCALAGNDLPPQRRAELSRRENQLLDQWDKEWVRPIRRLVRNGQYHRGFIDEAGMLARTFLKYADRLFRRVPLQHLHVVLYPWGRDYSPLVALAESEHLHRLRSLDLRENLLQSRDVRALVVSEHLTRLTALNLSRNRIGDGGIRALATAPLLGRLECLDLRGNDIGSNGLRALAHALESLDCSLEGLRLQRLELSFDNLSSAGQRVIVDSPLLRRLMRC